MIHFAGRKYVNESVENPLRYYDHNVAGTVELCKAMAKHGCKNVRFPPPPHYPLPRSRDLQYYSLLPCIMNSRHKPATLHPVSNHNHPL